MVILIITYNVILNMVEESLQLEIERERYIDRWIDRRDKEIVRQNERLR